jgi:hypothetical protein
MSAPNVQICTPYSSMTIAPVSEQIESSARVLALWMNHALRSPKTRKPPAGAAAPRVRA